MFETIEVRRAQNGFVLVVRTLDDELEFVFDTERKLLRKIKQFFGERVTNSDVAE